MAKPNRTKLSNDLIVAIYAEHEEEIADLWAIMGDEDEGTTGLNAFSVGAWAAAQDEAAEPLYGKIGQIVMWNKVL